MGDKRYIFKNYTKLVCYYLGKDKIYLSGFSFECIIYLFVPHPKNLLIFFFYFSQLID